jgi:hypothetical protein
LINYGGQQMGSGALVDDCSKPLMIDWKPIAIQQDFGGEMFFSPVPQGSSKN